MKVYALIIGIDGWSTYTAPLMESINLYEPDCQIVCIDNESAERYPKNDSVYHCARKPYAAAINYAAGIAHSRNLGHWPDWFVVLSNDVICTGPFIERLKETPRDRIVGGKLLYQHGWPYLEGWAVCVPTNIWADLGGWDKQFKVSSWEDVDFSARVLKAGYSLMLAENFTFTHLDQRQRFTLTPDYWDSEDHNQRRFLAKHGRVQHD